MESQLGQEFWEHGKAADCPIYDMHGHMGRWSGIYFPYAEPGEMVGIMDRSGVKMLFFSHHSALSAPDFSNTQAVEAVRSFPDRLRAYCLINPNYPDIADRDLGSFDSNRDVYFGLKFHATMHEVSLLDERYRKAFEFAEERGLPVLLHTWGRNIYCGEEVVRKLAQRYGNIRIIMGHSCRNMWDDAAALAKDYENVYLELCAVLGFRAGILEKFVNAAGSEKILFGTDFPWFNHHYYIGAVIAANITDENRRDIFYRNAPRLMKEQEIVSLNKGR